MGAPATPSVAGYAWQIVASAIALASVTIIGIAASLFCYHGWHMRRHHGIGTAALSALSPVTSSGWASDLAPARPTVCLMQWALHVPRVSAVRTRMRDPPRGFLHETERFVPFALARHDRRVLFPSALQKDAKRGSHAL